MTESESNNANETQHFMKLV